MFLANYGDGLSDVELPAMIDNFQRSKAVASLLLVQPTASFDIVRVSPGGAVGEISALTKSDIWINGGFFVMRNEIFRYMHPGEELVREPFQRLIEKNALLAYKCTGFWQCMDTFKDKQALEELNQGAAPWKVWHRGSVAIPTRPAGDLGRRMIGLDRATRAGGPLQILCLGATPTISRSAAAAPCFAWRSSIRTPCFIGWCSAPREFGEKRPCARRGCSSVPSGCEDRC